MDGVLLASLSFTVSLPFLWDVDHFSIGGSALFPASRSSTTLLRPFMPAQESREPLKLCEGGGLLSSVKLSFS